MNEYIGIDVSKASLQVYLPKADLDLEVENTPKGLKQLHTKLKKVYGKAVRDVVWIYEPTGSYSSLLERFCHEKAIRCFIVKPSQSAAFAKTIKNRNKTDLVDARMLQRMHTIADEQNITIPDHDARVDRLQAYIRYYKSIVKERVVKTNQLEAALAREDAPGIVHRLRTKIKALREEEKEIVETIKGLILSNEEHAKGFEAVTSFKGIGPIAGIVLLDLFMRYRDATSKQICALAGLDPIQIESGSSLKRKSRISKQGSRLVRSTLFMATLIAINHNPHMRAFYDRLKTYDSRTDCRHAQNSYSDLFAFQKERNISTGTVFKKYGKCSSLKLSYLILRRLKGGNCPFLYLYIVPFYMSFICPLLYYRRTKRGKKRKV